MLILRPNCERCDKDLPADQAGAVICSFECTFCIDCAQRLSRCPNCGGDFAPRPLRSRSLLQQFPASIERVNKHHE
ncbi:MAG: DUF1272 domain-containing protein [Pseudomonadota bacterium]|nr:DUF1272 domain-containing protein [Pseudomonadota bacterium]